MTIIRTMYCEKCFKQHRPHYADLFVREKDGFVAFDKIKETDHHNFGFTPHLIELLSIDGDVVSYRQICGMVDCGISVIMGDDNMPQLFDEAGDVVVKTQGTYWHYNDLGEAAELREDEPVYYQFQIIGTPVPGKMPLRDWVALLNYTE